MSMESLFFLKECKYGRRPEIRSCSIFIYFVRINFRRKTFKSYGKYIFIYIVIYIIFRGKLNKCNTKKYLSCYIYFSSLILQLYSEK
jgi:hypothetical protein